jgi:hypothetical protein
MYSTRIPKFTRAEKPACGDNPGRQPDGTAEAKRGRRSPLGGLRSFTTPRSGGSVPITFPHTCEEARMVPVSRAHTSVLRRVGAITIVGSAMSALAALPGVASAAAPVKCGSITFPVPVVLNGHAHGDKPDTVIDIVASGVSCRYAKTFIKDVLADNHVPPGWQYTPAKTVPGKYPVVITWKRGSARITYQYSCLGC